MTIEQKEPKKIKNKGYGTGRRKEAIARVFLHTGSGTVSINGRTVSDYFDRDSHQRSALEPLAATSTLAKYDVKAFVKGGGMTGQAGAVSHGIARALIAIDEEFRPTLRQGGYLTRDPRMKERKKYGRKGARKKFQFSKR